MSYDARVFTVLVASPGDVQEERQAIAEIIHEWNNLNSRDRSIVLLPLRWETHAHPEMGAEPQSIINRQLVDGCDMAVGVFWTRLGTPTTTAGSGSEEEIIRVGESGKPVMVYFSNAPISPGNLDLKELSRLREFQERQYPQGFVETYSSVQEFRDKFARQISAKIMEVAANDAKRQLAETEASGGAAEGAELLTLSVVGEPDKKDLKNPLSVKKLTCIDRGEIPDYREPKSVEIGRPFLADSIDPSSPQVYISMPEADKNYYRKVVEYAEKISTQIYFSFGLEAGHKAVRDVHVQMRVTVDGSVTLSRLPLYSAPGKHGSSVAFLGSTSVQPVAETIEISRVSRSEWAIEFDVAVVQASRKVFSPALYMRTDGNAKLQYEATVYSSESKPFLLEREVQFDVIPRELTHVEILKVMGQDLKSVK